MKNYFNNFNKAHSLSINSQQERIEDYRIRHISLSFRESTLWDLLKEKTQQCLVLIRIERNQAHIMVLIPYCFVGKNATLHLSKYIMTRIHQ